ncbi:uncharacterized protein MELLADRAFT_69687 [Melampsora larici-populina 98AG31]|uniref:Uncharacterized protein n=1 Tax=Melampsora larici-populina (strain 98AG31 / pathotype 3-4-7) TaxID=747676 RepID=F4SBR6_MELLP|nr:uncharacterized protein MELLADRAFT_69687 [Melampsora larici-populina 98AG31]EGF97912.1 hypothetical protein MELLADRAFT_69687 [Melampsora larici-populina 98AG31]
MFMENYVAFKGCIEILLGSAENISSQAESVQGAVDTFSHSHQDTSKNGSQAENYPSTMSDTVAFFDVMDTFSSKTSNEHTEDQDHQAHLSDSSESDSEMILKMLVPRLR